MAWLIKIIIGLFLSFFLLFGGFYLFVENVPYSEGTRTGKVIKISRKGYIFKTWEGELSQGLVVSDKFSFTVKDKEVIKKIQEYEGKDNVKLYYDERYTKFFWQGDTNYFITKCTLETNK